MKPGYLRPLVFGIACLIIIGTVTSSSGRSGREPKRILGFSARGAKRQLGIEARFKAIPQAEEIRKWHMSSRRISTSMSSN